MKRRLLYQFLLLILILSVIKGGYLLYLSLSETTTDRQIDDFVLPDAQYNAVFVGSSRTHYSIDPGVIDAICADHGLTTFNMGRSGRVAPETYADVSYFIQQARNLKVILVEVQGLAPSGNTSADFFAPDLQAFNLNYTLGTLGSAQIQPTLNAAQAYAINTFKLKSSLVERPFRVTDKVNEPNGFLGLNEQTADRVRHRFRRAMLRKPDDFRERGQVFADFANNRSVNSDPVYTESLEKLIETARRKGIHVLLYLPNSIDIYEIEWCLPVIQEIPDDYSLGEFNDPRILELFDLKYMWDRYHLNADGASLFSTIIGQQLDKKLDEIEFK